MKKLTILLAAAAFLTTSCENLTPDERALIVRTADQAIQIGLNKLAQPQPQKVVPQK